MLLNTISSWFFVHFILRFHVIGRGYVSIKPLFLLLLKASKFPMSIIIVGVGPAEFDGKCFFYIFLKYLLTF